MDDVSETLKETEVLEQMSDDEPPIPISVKRNITNRNKFGVIKRNIV